MAALRSSSLLLPSPAAVASRPRSRGALGVPPTGWREFKIQVGNNPRRLCHAVRCQKGHDDLLGNFFGGLEPESAGEKKFLEELGRFAQEYKAKVLASNPKYFGMQTHFRKEKDKILDYKMRLNKKLNSHRNTSAGMDALLMAWEVCKTAEAALHMASKIMNCASLPADLPTKISERTINQTVRMYPTIFVNIAEQAYQGKVQKTTFISILDALHGLAAISYILLEDSLAAADEISPEDSPLKRKLSCDLDDIACHHRHFEEVMNGLKINCTVNTPLALCMTLQGGMKLVEDFIEALTVRRRNLHGK